MEPVALLGRAAYHYAVFQLQLVNMSRGGPAAFWRDELRYTNG